jgi:ribonuclease VapC
VSIVVDSSALMAIALRESTLPDIEAILRPIDDPLVSAATWLETSIVIDGRRDAQLMRRWDELAEQLQLLIVDVTDRQARIARDAYRDFGRGSGHPAGLNFGDCFAYALAHERRLPLLAVGNDFRHTDLTVVP